MDQSDLRPELDDVDIESQSMNYVLIPAIELQLSLYLNFAIYLTII